MSAHEKSCGLPPIRRSRQVGQWPEHGRVEHGINIRAAHQLGHQLGSLGLGRAAPDTVLIAHERRRQAGASDRAERTQVSGVEHPAHVADRLVVGVVSGIERVRIGAVGARRVSVTKGGKYESLSW
jgi:hypothetical protein